MKMHSLDLSYRERCWKLLEKLYPMYRTILGEGFQTSLKIIKEIISISILEFPSGSRCGSWTIPHEWTIKDAFIADLKGRKIIDFERNNFHIWQYSIPFSGDVSREELMNHICTCPYQIDAIPLCVTYYNKNWGFSISEEQKGMLTDETYYVEIDSEFKDGMLTIGELVIPGKKKDEIIIDSVLSCTSLANNLSGVVIAVYIADLISKLENTYYSYRILFTPETIGPIALHYLHKDFRKNIVGGYTLVNLADKSSFNYRKSRNGNTVADKAMCHSLRFFSENYQIEEYDVLTGTCGNEKAYNSLGIEIPVGSFRRSPLGSYPEYDTSRDNLRFVDTDMMFGSLQVLWGAVQSLERSQKYRHEFEGEPFLTGYGLFPKIESDGDRIPYDYLMGFSTGDLTLVDMAEKANIPVTDFDEAVSLMVEKGLIKEVSTEGVA